MRLSDRWIPVVAATVGVLGGMAGALVGGYISNKGQEQQFENQREAAKEDLRQGAYANFSQEGYSFLLRVQVKAQTPPGTEEDQQATEDELEAHRQALAAAEAAVAIYGTTELNELADLVLNDLIQEKQDDARDHLVEFTAKAKEDIGVPNGD